MTDYVDISVGGEGEDRVVGENRTTYPHSDTLTQRMTMESLRRMD